MRRVFRVIVTGAAFVLSASSMFAQVTVGTARPHTGNCDPWGCEGGSTRYEQIFASDAFSGPIDIGSLTYYHTQITNPDGVYDFRPGTYSVYFSTRSGAIDDIGNDLDVNVTNPEQLFGTFVLGGSVTGTSFTLTGMNPFLYDPSVGNLLMDIRITQTGDTPAPTYWDADYSNQVTARAYTGPTDPQYEPGSDGIGLVTTFGPSSVTTTPEPSSLALVATGLLTLGSLTRRKRKA